MLGLDYVVQFLLNDKLELKTAFVTGALCDQFEDFQNKWAFRLLQRYRHYYRMFNDDVQVTTPMSLLPTSLVMEDLGFE